ncbi:energy transducer TonB [Flavobacterium sp. ANB]|uniref:energy transducer TonB n=1 Tax=unclassified Flavobacterium TaxID=196869 RepID=UPI0012B7B94F|nr:MULTISPECIES: energy transducer TonB [unclassified Flavobacterium]MBF4517497.1 energy transducer TonB [Flavobacterium sp. ANB]MTD72127.1 energy transducer TonB [Flavobacterium sp. LC2016-13]
MSNSSIYETKWTNLVFENKNKEYGAYQLRQENSKTTVTALFMALLLIATIGSISMLISKFRTVDPVIIDGGISIPITPVKLDPIIQPKQPEPIVQPKHQSTPTSTDLVQLTNPVVVTSNQATTDVIATNTQNVPTVDNSTGNGNALNPSPTTGNGVVDVAEPVDPNSVLNTAELDKMPEFPGGMGKFYTYVGNNFTRPELDAERTLKVYVSFVIEKDGSITDIMVRNDPGYGVGKEAIRVLKSIKTKWSPGILNGKPVRTAYNLPITIKTEVE